MLPLDHPDRIQIAFDDHRLVANAGLLLPVTLAQHLGLRELVDNHVDLADAPGRANPGDKMLTLVASALAGGDCIDDADVLRTGGTAQTLGCVVKAPSTLGTFLRSFRWGHVRQLDRVSRELLARAWSAGAGPGDAPFTIDLDSTICETYGLAKEGARDHGYTGKRGYHPLLAVAAGTGDVLMARLREGRANTARGAAHFLRETVSCVRRWGGCATPGPGDNSRCGPTAASTPTPWSPPAAGWMSATPSPSARVPACAVSSRPYPSRTGRPSPTGWTAPPTWPKPATLPSRASPTPRRCGSSSGGCTHARFPVGPLRHLPLSRLHHRPGGGNPGIGGRPSAPRRDRERHPRPQVRRGVEPSPFGPLPRQRRLAGGAGDRPQPCMVRRDATDRSNLG